VEKRNVYNDLSKKKEKEYLKDLVFDGMIKIL